MKQAAGGERERLCACRCERLHLNVAILALGWIGPPLHRDRLKIANENQGVGLLQFPLFPSGPNEIGYVASRLVSEQKDGMTSGRNPRREHGHAAGLGVSRVGDDQGSNGALLSLFVPAALGDGPFIGQLDYSHFLQAAGELDRVAGSKHFAGVPGRQALAQVSRLIRSSVNHDEGSSEGAGQGGALEEDAARLGRADHNALGPGKERLPKLGWRASFPRKRSGRRHAKGALDFGSARREGANQNESLRLKAGEKGLKRGPACRRIEQQHGGRIARSHGGRGHDETLVRKAAGQVDSPSGR